VNNNSLSFALLRPHTCSLSWTKLSRDYSSESESLLATRAIAASSSSLPSSSSVKSPQAARIALEKRLPELFPALFPRLF